MTLREIAMQRITDKEGSDSREVRRGKKDGVIMTSYDDQKELKDTGSKNRRTKNNIRVVDKGFEEDTVSTKNTGSKDRRTKASFEMKSADALKDKMHNQKKNLIKDAMKAR